MPKCHCGKRAYYNIRGEKQACFCTKHKEPNMVDVKSKRCEANGCEKQSAYNIRGEKQGRFCAEHKEPNMVDVKNKTCEIDGCEILPVFNIRGEKQCRFCVEHKEPHMVDVKHKICEIDGCETRPSYNIRGKKSGRFCVEHKEPNMINVKNKTCETDGCETQPSYNICGEKKGRFCSKHKDSNMIDVINKTCEVDGCEILPTFNIRGEKKARFCAVHKESNMINVVNKRCEEDGCEIRCNYGLLGKGVTHCSQHRKKGMIRTPNRKCEHVNCNQLGTHEANGARMCDDHMTIGAENLGVDTCISCGLDDILTNGKCSICDPHIIKLRQHATENRIRDVLNANGLNNYVHDKMLEGPLCGRERPDFQWDCGTHYLFVEVDEHQHSSYACECEQIRMRNLVEVRGMPVRWIRYNPDVYEPMKGQRKIVFEQREKKLVEYVKWAMKYSPEEDGNVSSVLYLFYDDYDTKGQEWYKLV